MKNFKKAYILVLLACSDQTCAMMRSVSQMALSPVAAVLLLTSKRFLCSNQATDPMWLKANYHVDDFRRKHGLPTADPAVLDSMSSIIDLKFRHNCADKIDHGSVDIIRPIVEPLIKKHGLDITKVQVTVVNDSTIVPFAATAGNSLIFSKQFLAWPLSWQIATIEHELGHMFCQDSAYNVFYEQFRKFYNLPAHANLEHEYKLLIERRADTHSALQSLQNTKALMDANNSFAHGGNPEHLKNYEIKKCELDQTLDRETKEKKLKELQKKLTYLEELFKYMYEKKDSEKALPPIIQL